MKFKMSYPVKPLFINQKFGEIANLAYYKANGLSFIGHNGIDFMAKHGQPVYAAHDGIAYPEVDNKSGHGVVVVSINSYFYDTDKHEFISDEEAYKRGYKQ